MLNTYGYEIWLEGNCLRSSENADLDFFTEAEATEEAENEVYELLEEYEDYDFDDFEIVIVK